jgi:hypothetical protein
MGYYKLGNGGVRETTKVQKSKTVLQAVMVTVTALVPLILYIFITTRPPSPVTGKLIEKERFNPTITFTTDWFSFTAPNRWEEAADQHIEDKVYIYRERRGGEFLGLMRIYVNNTIPTPQDMYTSIVPTSLGEDQKLLVGPAEPHCSEATESKKKLGNPISVLQAEVTFTCWVDNENFIAALGVRGGTTALQLRRKNGEISTYRVVYSNTAFTPSRGSLSEVMRTFQAY